MTEFTVRGQWSARDGWQNFEKSIEADNEDVAVEHTYSEFGSKHGLKRTQVEISEVSAETSGSRPQAGDEEVSA